MRKLKWFVAIVILSFLSLATYEIFPESPKGRIIKEYDGIKGDVIRIPNLKVQFWNNGDLFAARGMAIYRSRDFGLIWEKVAKLGKGKGGLISELRARIGSLKLVSKLRNKSGIDRVMLLENGMMLVVYRGIFSGMLREGEVTRLENIFHWEGGGPLPQGFARDSAGYIYVGEYLVDKPGKRHRITNLYCGRAQEKTWKVCYDFQRSEIMHIHGVSYDKYRDLLWLTTGDRDHESRILYSSDHGISFTPLGTGSQDWRTVSLQFTPEFIYWGTDSPVRWNHIFKWNWDTGDRETMLTVRNPFYYSAHDADKEKLYFSTTVEKVDLDIPSSQFAEIWEVSLDNKSPRRLLSWRKGNLNSWGKIQFAQGEAPPGWLAFTPINLGDHHYETVVMKVIE